MAEPVLIPLKAKYLEAGKAKKTTYKARAGSSTRSRKNNKAARLKQKYGSYVARPANRKR